MSKTILICGATGFIGRNLVNHYAKQGHVIKAVCFRRPPFDTPENVTWVQADLRDPLEVDRLVEGTDIIIQAAATTSGSKDIVNMPYIHVTDNAVMNSYLLRSAYDHSVEQFIFFSCTVMYPSLDHPVKESDFTGDITPKYFGVGSTKVYIEKMCEFYAGLGRTKHTVIRHSNIYGPYDKFDLERSHVFGATITKTMLAKDVMSVWGTGEEKRDLLHVSDLMTFIDLCLQKQENAYELLNCGSGQPVSVKELVEKVIQHSGKKLRVEHDLSQPTIPFNLVVDYGKAASLLGWHPKIMIDEGIKDTLGWWQHHIDPETLTLIVS